ncbi:MAG: hypothetical protein OHK0046_01880 [Anaerolineae bacterium]
MYRIAALFMGLCLLVGVTIAQDEPPLDPDVIGAPGVGDPYFPTEGNGGYDVVNYNLDFDVEISDNTMEAVVTISAIATQDLGRFNLDFEGFRISELMVNDLPAEFERTAGELIITTPDILAEGDPFTVTITYSGKPGWTYYGTGAFIAGEPSEAPKLYPVNAHPIDKATYRFEVTARDAYVVAANGLLQEIIDHPDETSTHIWLAESPMTSYLVTVAVGDYRLETEETPDGLPIRNYFATTLPPGTVDTFERTSEMIAFFEAVFGPYPFEVYGVVVHPVPLGFALETQTLSTFGSTINQEFIVAHELAHQWFGDSVSLTRWSDLWLNEGFASYAEVLWTEHTEGRDAADASIRQRYTLIAAPDPIAGTLNRASLNNFLNSANEAASFDDILFSAADTRWIIELFLGETLSAEEIEDIIATLPTLAVTGEDIRTTLREAEFNRVTLRVSQVAEFLRLIGAEEDADALVERSRAQRRAGDPTPEFLFSVGVYQRGALTLHALRLEIGDEAFFETLQTYTSRFANRNATTEDFINIAEEISGQELDAFFEAWLYDPLVPNIAQMELFRDEL